MTTVSLSKRASIALSLAAVALVTFAAAQPAVASTSSYGQCPNNRFCVWENDNGTGRFAQFEWGSPDLSKAVGGYVFNDKISSVWNRTGYKWCLYEHKDFSPSGKILPVGDYMGSVAIPRYSFNDITSSLRACS